MSDSIQNPIPVLPIRNAVIFPGLALPLRVGRRRSIAAIEAARKGDQESGWILAVTQMKESEEGADPQASDLRKIGTLCKIERVRGTAAEGYQVLVRGVSRYRVSDWKEAGDLTWAEGSEWPDQFDVDSSTAQALLGSLKSVAGEILELLPADTEQLQEMVSGIQDLSFLTYLCAANLELKIEQRHELLEMVSVKNRALKLLDYLTAQKDALAVQGEIRNKLSQRIGKGQREAILREQIKAIREELGDADDPAAVRDDYRKKIEQAQMPEEVEKVALEEAKRLESIGSSSPESNVIRNYLDLLCAMPWSKSAEGQIDLEFARQTLNHDHYGLEKIKKRVLQHLAVMKLKKSNRGSILLFVGPPGVGKTSLGQSIAKALGRKFVRGSLGGVRDDAEIRGHRRTYIGAMPGRIIQGIKRAGENNPVFMLDEIDKLGRGFQGDPASALLEVLDPEQNATFMDHYLDVPFDLSKVLFIATANTLETVPGPLLDRMEIIELTGYTTAEKFHIARAHLIPKQMSEFGMSAEQIDIPDETLQKIIAHHTREAGVRDLQRQIATLLRASAVRVAAGDAVLPIRIDVSELEEHIGPERFMHEVAERKAMPGVVTGLAWTPLGGEILFIEAGLMPGSGKLTLTGQLGDVMKESAQIALSLVRSRLPEIVPGFEYEKKDLHIHVPAGAIPKDGPSAGVAILTTIASLFSGRAVDPTIAMTGEITLRGAVMPVGGIKEKVMAAHRAGIRAVILPKRNQKDLREVPEDVKSQIRFEFAETAADVLQVALGMEIGLPRIEKGRNSDPTPAVA